MSDEASSTSLAPSKSPALSAVVKSDRKAACPRRNLQVHHLAGHTHRLFGSNAKGVDEAADFPFRVLDRLAGFDTERQRELVEAFLEPNNAVVQDIPALIRSLSLIHI